jgi:very-short-patch-repair endonuclease
MLERSIAQLIELFSRGTTDSQLLWRLRSNGLRNDASSVLAALRALSDRGEIRRSGNKWHAAPRVGAEPVGRPTAGSVDEPLRAVRLTLSALSAEPSVEESSALRQLPVWKPLLQYYAATQRQDPRGSVERFRDQHGAGWQLFDCTGRWWEEVRLATSADQLPPRLREALAMIGDSGAASVGWPIAVVRGPEGPSFLPVLLLPVTWELAPDTLSVTPQKVPPTLNPAWIRQVRRRTQWTEESLSAFLLGDEDEADLGAMAPRLAHALANLGGSALRPADLAPELACAGEGLRNAAAFFLPDETAFTRQTARDIDGIADWPETVRRRTALSFLLDEAGSEGPEPTTLVSPVELSESQREAAASALSRRVTAIQGPPGTGKSQTIVALIASAVVARRSVIFVSRNHRALDEVEERIGRLMPGVPLVTRGRDAEGTRDASLADALVAIAQGGTLADEEARRIEAMRSSLLGEAKAAALARADFAARERLDLELSDLAEQAATLRGSPAPGGAPSRSRGARLVAALLRLFRRPWRPKGIADVASLDGKIRRLRRERAATPLPPGPEDPDALPRLSTIATGSLTPEPGTHEHLAQLKAELQFQPGGLKPQAISADDARIILDHRPVWAISSLSVPARMPLVPGLFDIAIFDEASQCDIASALPILARARQAIIVGDPEQLRFIPGLGRAQEHALMDAVGLPKPGRASFAQSVNSLFDFAARRIGAGGTRLLTDQFRSAPDIVDYVSEAFYGGRLVARRSDEDLRTPGDYRPGLHWEDVRGQTGREDGGNVNRAEAEAIVARLAALAADRGFDGSVGVISPFNAQVDLIRRRAEETLSAAQRDRLALQVGTVDRWQGGEADVIFFSLVTAAGAPFSATTFLSRERRRINVAISRARAVAVVVGDLGWARASGIAHVAELADRATRLRERPQRGYDSLWERRMHEALRGRGIEAHPQYQVGSRSLDFALFAEDVKLDLEVDGRAWHTGAGGGRKTADRLRDRELMAKGWKVRRFWVHQLAEDMEGCLDTIERDLGRR